MRKHSLIVLAASLAMGGPIFRTPLPPITPKVIDPPAKPTLPQHDLDCLAKAQAKRDRKAKKK